MSFGVVLLTTDGRIGARGLAMRTHASEHLSCGARAELAEGAQGSQEQEVHIAEDGGK